MKKGQILEGVIEKVEFPNKGLVYVAEEDQYVLVKNGIPGQKIRFGINKFKHGRAEGRLLEVLERSPLETREPVCSLFPACGGCMYQTMSYEAQLEMKAEQMKEIIEGALASGHSFVFEGIKASPKEFGYRNKMEFSFGDEYKDGPLSLGLHKKGSTYDILTASDCKLVHEDMTKILTCVPIIVRCSIPVICAICFSEEEIQQGRFWSIWLQPRRKHMICSRLWRSFWH